MQPMAKRYYPPISKGRRNPIGISASLMSDTKWRKLFVALDRPELNLRQVRIKWVDVNQVVTAAMPTAAYLWPPKPFIGWDTPVPLRAIEWIEIPAIATFPRPSPDGKGRIPPELHRQDIDRAEAILTAIGQFPMERNGDALRIIGHVR
jgi:hypothetical protein